MSTFSVVATPIGNLEDITLRALDVLRGADLILCEDTRMTKRLLDRHDIHVATKSYHMHSQLSRKEEIVGLLKEGKNLALVSDAGTPGISDPGVELVKYIRQELAAEVDVDLNVNSNVSSVKIEAIPGASALTAAISIAGVSCADFTFLGFLPHKKGRETLFKEIAAAERTMIFYESPHRIIKTLESLVEYVGLTQNVADIGAMKKLGKTDMGAMKNLKITDSDKVVPKLAPKKVTVCRELTKVFEEVVAGSAEEVRDYFTKNSDKVRGEFVVLVS